MSRTSRQYSESHPDRRSEQGTRTRVTYSPLSTVSSEGEVLFRSPASKVSRGSTSPDDNRSRLEYPHRMSTLKIDRSFFSLFNTYERSSVRNLSLETGGRDPRCPFTVPRSLSCKTLPSGLRVGWVSSGPSVLRLQPNPDRRFGSELVGISHVECGSGLPGRFRSLRFGPRAKGTDTLGHYRKTGCLGVATRRLGVPLRQTGQETVVTAQGDRSGVPSVAEVHSPKGWTATTSEQVKGGIGRLRNNLLS